MKVKCNKCNKNTTPIVNERYIGNGEYEVYLVCSQCKDETKVAIINNEIKRLQNEREIYLNQRDTKALIELDKIIRTEVNKLNGKSL